VKEIADVRLPTLRGKKRSMNTTIPVWGAVEVDPDLSKIGLKGSPTRVVKIETPKVSRSCKTLVIGEDMSAEQAVSELVEFLETRNLLSEEA
jgi:electron transfer flavoprotein beta subunit